MKKALKITAAVIAILLIVGILWVYNSFCGNIFSAMYAKNQIEKYIDKTYPNNDYEIGNAEYDFKFGVYGCRITDPDSEDGSFTAALGQDGEVTDNYDNLVKDLNNTISRLDSGLRDAIDPLIDSYLDEDAGEFGFATVIGEKEVDYSKLYLDMKFDVKNMPIETYVCVCFKSGSRNNLMRIQKISNDLKTLGYRIDYYSFDYNDSYYECVPTQELLNVSDVSDLAEYRLLDDIEKDKK